MTHSQPDYASVDLTIMLPSRGLSSFGEIFSKTAKVSVSFKVNSNFEGKYRERSHVAGLVNFH